MKVFDYKIRDEIGMHARPAGLLGKKAGEFQSKVIIVNKNGRESRVDGLMGLLGLGVMCGDVVTVKVEGPDEEIASQAIYDFMEKNL